MNFKPCMVALQSHSQGSFIRFVLSSAQLLSVSLFKLSHCDDNRCWPGSWSRSL